MPVLELEIVRVIHWLQNQKWKFIGLLTDRNDQKDQVQNGLDWSQGIQLSSYGDGG